MSTEINWNVGDKFTTPETGDLVFSVLKVAGTDVEAYDGRSRAGVSVFTKSWITKVENTKVSQSELEIAKYDTIEKIVAQLEKCNYECEAGTLKMNVAFIALKRMIK